MKRQAIRKNLRRPEAATALHRQAEARLNTRPPHAAPPPTEADTQRLVHELKVHQIELEMQNEELRRVRDELEAGLEKFSDLYDFAPVGYLTLDAEGTIGEANLTAASLFGIERSLLIEKRFAVFVAPADRPSFNTFLKIVFATRVRAGCDVSLQLKGQPRMEVRIRANVLASGQACRVTVSDISEHKRAEAVTAQLAAIVQSSSDAIIGKDLDSRVTSWNAGAQKLFGYSADEMVGQSITRLMPADRPEEEAQIMERIRRGESVEHFETVRVAKDGRPLELSVMVSPIRRANGEIVGAAQVAHDITERKQAEADRLILSKLESTGILAGGIAHDFNNLLTIILLDMELAGVLSPPNPELAHCLAEAKQAALAASGLTQQFITFAKGGAPVRKTTHLSAVIRESVQLALSGSSVGCEFDLAQDLWVAEVDAGQLGQVIHNLVMNAREAMPPGGVVSVRAENVVLQSNGPPALPPGDYIRLSIADQGVGIPAEVLPKIFDPYFSTKQRGKEKGMGLGLTICHSVIQKHDAAITVDSVVGTGTTFQIHLPASRKVPRAKQPAEPARPRPRGKILVMDDEEGMRKVLGSTLRGMGHEVKLVPGGRAAIAAYGTAQREGNPFDVVVLDLTVRAGLGGQAALQALLEVDPQVNAIVMSGHADDPVVLAPERYGFKAALAKPFDRDHLQTIISRVFESLAAP